MERKVKFEKLAMEYFLIGGKMRRAAIAWLKLQLKKIPDMDFSDMEYRITVSYNGGNHPEYASTCFSFVNGIYLANGLVRLNIEDCSGYDIEELTSEEVFDVCDYVKNVYLPTLKE